MMELERERDRARRSDELGATEPALDDGDRRHRRVRARDVTAGYGRSRRAGRRRSRDPDRLAARGDRAERRGQEHAAQGHRRLLPPFSGTVEVLGGPPGARPSAIAYVPQAELVDWAFPVTVGDVVMMGRVPLIGIGRSPGAHDRERGRGGPRDGRDGRCARSPDRRPVGWPAPARLPGPGVRRASPTCTCSTSR